MAYVANVKEEQAEAKRLGIIWGTGAWTMHKRSSGYVAPAETLLITAKQLNVLYKFGIEPNPKMHRKNASLIIGLLFDRNDNVWDLVKMRVGYHPSFK